MSETRENLLSELYWRLHRNATLSSFLLFLSANHLINIKLIEGATVKIPDSLLSILIAIWATYAIIVFVFEGGREEALKTEKARSDIKETLRVVNETYNLIYTNINIRSANLDSSVRTIEHFASILNKTSDPNDPLANLPHSELQKILNSRIDEINHAVTSVSNSTNESKHDLNRVEKILQTNNKNVDRMLFRDRVRSFVTGLWPPRLLYALALLHFFGNYFTLGHSILDWMRWMQFYWPDLLSSSASTRS